MAAGTRQGRDVDDASPACDEHPPACLLTAAKPPHGENLNLPLNAVDRYLLGGSTIPFASHISEDVDPAERLIHSSERGANLVRVEHITRKRDCSAAEPGDHFRGTRIPVWIKVQQGQVGARLCEADRHRATESARGSGHDRKPGGQVE